KYATESGAYIRQHFFGPDPRLRQMVEHLTDPDLQALPRGGHDYRKLYAAYKAATEHEGAPTAILAQTIKGWTLGPEIEARNATHQIKKMTKDQVRVLRDRLYLENEIPDSALDGEEDPPYYRPAPGSAEHEYLMSRRQALHGSLPKRVNRSKALAPTSEDTFAELLAGSGKQAVSTGMGFARLLRHLVRDPSIGPRVVPIVPDEARTFGFDSLFREIGIYASSGQLYTPVDAGLLLSYTEKQDGQILEEGITEAGSMADFIAAGTAYATWGQPMIPFYIFYSMFGFQRTGDLIWAAGDIRARGFLLGATAGRTTLEGEGLQHDDGHSLLVASTIPSMAAYDPAFAYEVALIVAEGIRRMVGLGAEDVMYYLTLYNQNYLQPPAPTGQDGDRVREGVLRGIYRFAAPAEVAQPRDGRAGARQASIWFSGPAYLAAMEAREI
ncbi:MAG: pyruvate dehydrogenase (acetyl-transferring), homodimeric type, partial [Actinomycetes bacterium]